MNLVIGGSGFIGTRLCALFVDENIPFRIADIRRSDFFPESWVPCDITNLEELDQCFHEVQPSVIIHLAAQHRDDVSPRSLYFDVNVTGTKNVCDMATKFGVKKLIFTSSVAVYGFAPLNTDESGAINYFNEYGRTKFLAEEVLRSWKDSMPQNELAIIRPTVVFGERNRGNVYNLLHQISKGSFLMVGRGTNRKSMAYVGNVAAFVKFLARRRSRYLLVNYVDKPDLDMQSLVRLVYKQIGRDHKGLISIPVWIGMLGGYLFDLLSALTKRKFAISSIRVKKFVKDTVFAADSVASTGFLPPYTILEAVGRTVKFEFIDENSGSVFLSE